MLNPSIFAWLKSIWGPHTLTGFQMLGMHSCKDLIQNFGSLAQRLWMLLLALALEKTIVDAHQ